MYIHGLWNQSLFILLQHFFVSHLCTQGERKLKEFKSMVGYVDQKTNHRKDIVDEDSWLNIKDPDDPRGRVGTVWPWQREGKDS